MKIPPSNGKRSDRFRRIEFVHDLKDRCLVTRTERREQYVSNRLYWLYGSDGSYENTDTDTALGPPPGNKLWPHIDQLSSFTYAQDTTRFSTEIGQSVNHELMQWVPTIDQYVNDHWHSSNTDIVFGLANVYSLVYGSTFLAPRWKKNEIQPRIVMPHNFGVLREDTFQLSAQEAFCHCFYVTEGQFRNDFSFIPSFESIFRKISRTAATDVPSEQNGVDRIIMAGQDPLNGTGGSGEVDWLSQVSQTYIPRVKEPMIEMFELYVWDDEVADYRIFTFVDPSIPVLDRAAKQAGWLEHTPPFIQVCPNPDPNYFYGISEVERLTPLQIYRNKIMAQIDHLQELEAHPPSTASGFPGDLLEIQYALDTPNGMLNQPDPGGAGGQVRADRVKIELPPDLYARLDRCDQMFEDMSGLPAITQGKNAPGVRSGGHASELAKLGATRAKKRALIIEDSLEQVATIYLKLLKRYDNTQLTTKLKRAGKPEEFEKFVADQFTDDAMVKVDGHSSSPIFMDDATAIAFQLLKSKAITRKRLLQLVPVPMRQQLIWDLENEIEPQEQAAAEAQQKLEQSRIQSKAEGRPGKPNGAHPSQGAQQ